MNTAPQGRPKTSTLSIAAALQKNNCHGPGAQVTYLSQQAAKKGNTYRREDGVRWCLERRRGGCV
jgi:hypothetical protein